MVLVLGAAIGALAASMAANALRLQRAHARGAMALLQYHQQRLRDVVRREECGTQAGAHLRQLALLVPEIGPAFPERAQDRVFAQRLRTLEDRANAAALAAPLDCRALEQARAGIAEACDHCHRDYR